MVGRDRELAELLRRRRRRLLNPLVKRVSARLACGRRPAAAMVAVAGS